MQITRRSLCLQVMENGRAAEFGSPRELLANKQGVFTSMVNETGKATAKMLRGVASGATSMKESRSAAAKSAQERSATRAPALTGLQARRCWPWWFVWAC